MSNIPLNKERNNNKGPRINQKITAKKVFLIDEVGTKIGVLSFFEALNIAQEKGLDLVEVAKNEFPPVCKIMDYGKHCFLTKKNQSKAKKESKSKEPKEIRVRPSIEDNDFQVKLKHLIDFLEDGYKVTIVLKYKGRQIVHPEIGIQVLKNFVEFSKHVGKMEGNFSVEGKKTSILIIPVKKKNDSNDIQDEDDIKDVD